MIGKRFGLGRILVCIVLPIVSLTACLQPPTDLKHPGQRTWSDDREVFYESVLVRLDDSGTACTWRQRTTGGETLKEGTISETSLLVWSIMHSPVEMQCRQDGFEPYHRTIFATDSSAFSNRRMVINVLAGGLLGAVTTGRNMEKGLFNRFPPVVDVVMVPADQTAFDQSVFVKKMARLAESYKVAETEYRQHCDTPNRSPY